MSVIRNADGRLEVFAVGRDGALIHVWQEKPNGDWSNWQSLGGGPASAPAAGRNADGRLEVFAVAEDGTLMHIWQNAPSSNWSRWESLGGRFYNVTPAVARNADGRLEVFTVYAWEVWHIWQTAPSRGPWSGWELMGDDFRTSAVGFARLAVARNSDGRLEVFVAGRHRLPRLWHAWQNAPNSAWSPWESLGGQVQGTPAVARNADGRLEVFVVAAFDDIRHIWQTRASLGPWSQWEPLGPPDGDLSVGRNADGRLEAFVGTNGVFHYWQTAPARGPWTVFQQFDGRPSAPIAVSSNADGRLELFAVDNHDGIRRLQHRWQTVPNGGWSDWHPLGDYEISSLGPSADWTH